MNNAEKYKGVLLKTIQDTCNTFAFDGRNILECKYDYCSVCIFRTGVLPCNCQRVTWLCSEYQEPTPKLTKEEAIFCNIVDGFIARDKDGNLTLYSSEPYLENEHWFNSDIGVSGTTIKSDLFPFITYKSEKYWSIEELLKLGVEE